MDFVAEVQSLLDQIPVGRVARCGDIARALGDVRASAAVFRLLRDRPDLRGADRIVSAAGEPVVLHESAMMPRGQAGRFTDFHGDAPLSRLRAEQDRIAAKVSRRNGFERILTVAGVDLSYAGDRGFASLVVLRNRDLTVIEEVLVSREVEFPYIPTYLAYREFPLIAAAVERLGERPTVLLVDGQGQLHPAKCGLACLVGVRLGQPTIGVAKSPLAGTVRFLPRVREASPIDLDGRVMGYALRTSSSAKPLYVSTGHLVHPRTAIRVVRDLARMKHPEPLRLAHVRATEWKRRQKEKGLRRFESRSHPKGADDP